MRSRSAISSALAYLACSALLCLKNSITKPIARSSAPFPTLSTLLLICSNLHVDRNRLPQGSSAEYRNPLGFAVGGIFTSPHGRTSYFAVPQGAYENLAKRTGLEGVKSAVWLCSSRNATDAAWPSPARHVSGNRATMRMNEAEKRPAYAAAEADRADILVSSCRCCFCCRHPWVQKKKIKDGIKSGNAISFVEAAVDYSSRFSAPKLPHVMLVVAGLDRASIPAITGILFSR